MNAVEALHAVSGLSLVVFPEDGVRAALPAGRRLEDLSADELTALRADAAPLTATERLLDVDGEPWLMQQTGPAWAESGQGAADLCGLLFTRLDGSQERHAVVGRPPGPPPPDDELGAILGAARSGGADAGGEPLPGDA
jgi:hypothetical protein